MAWRNLSNSSFFSRRERPARRLRPRDLGFCVVVMFAVVTGCGTQPPAAPGLGLLTVSGYVYQRGSAGDGEPLLDEALITVQEGQGSPQTAISNDRGFYTVSVRAGSISITASKAGYVTRASRFDVSDDTTLNFSLSLA